MLAGALYLAETDNTNYYLYTNKDYWLMSPFFYSTYNVSFDDEGSYNLIVHSNGYLYADRVNSTYSVRPSISLASGTKIASGNGSQNSPYVIE